MTHPALLSALLSAPLLMAFIAPASAADIYRCGPQGSAYSQTPCANGTYLALADARNDEQRREARLVALRTEALAASLEQDRLTAESVDRPALAVGFKSSASPGSRSAASALPARGKAKRPRSPVSTADRARSP